MTLYRAGNYVSCTHCGRLLRIDWPTRSIVCSCGQRFKHPPSATDEAARARAADERAPADGPARNPRR